MLRTKRLFVAMIILTLALYGSAQAAPEKTEIPDELWEELSSNLAELQAMIDSFNQYRERERAMLKVKADPWLYPEEAFIKLATTTETKLIPIAKVAAAKIPTKEGLIAVEIVKIKERKYKEPKTLIPTYWVVQSKALDFTAQRPILPILGRGKLLKKAGFSVHLDPRFTKVASKELVAFLEYDKKIEHAYMEITKAIKDIQEKYMKLPIYIEGFTVHLGIVFSVDIDFKFK